MRNANRKPDLLHICFSTCITYKQTHARTHGNISISINGNGNSDNDDGDDDDGDRLSIYLSIYH